MINGQPQVPPIEAYNDLAAGGGTWAGFRTDPPRIVRSSGQVFDGTTNPMINAVGRFGYVTPYASEARRLIVSDETIRSGPITDARMSNQAVVWLESRRTWGARLNIDRQPQSIHVLDTDEFRPVRLTPGRPWVLSTTHQAGCGSVAVRYTSTTAAGLLPGRRVCRRRDRIGFTNRGEKPRASASGRSRVDSGAPIGSPPLTAISRPFNPVGPGCRLTAVNPREAADHDSPARLREQRLRTNESCFRWWVGNRWITDEPR